MELNERVGGIAPSLTLAIDAKAKALIAAGEKVCGFGAGEPDFDTPEHIKDAAAQALRDGKTKYAPNDGIMELRAAIADKLAAENKLSYKIEQVLVSNGAKHSLFNIFMALCREGDEIIIPAPYWLSYPEMVRVAGGKPVFVTGSEAHGLKVTASQVEAVITNRTKAIVINSPSNPTGMVYTRAELRALAEVAVKHNLTIVSDEIYERMVYDNTEAVSIGSLSPEIFKRTVTVNGFSKPYAMTGWRLGYFAGPLELVKACSALQSHSTSAPNTFAQYGAVAALRGSQECVAKMVKAFDERRQYLYNRLTAIEGITCVKPAGAFYVFPNISSFGLSSIAFSEKLLEREKMAVVPGVPFGADANIRLSYACSLANIEEGLIRLERFIKGLA
ncbi:MAG: pyridoxal phosphate-dependent aminotransferase [bacterium]